MVEGRKASCFLFPNDILKKGSKPSSYTLTGYHHCSKPSSAPQQFLVRPSNPQLESNPPFPNPKAAPTSSKSTSMAVIQDLPQEVLSTIFQQMHPDHDEPYSRANGKARRASLLNVALVCRDWVGPAQGELWVSLSFECGEKGGMSKLFCESEVTRGRRLRTRELLLGGSYSGEADALRVFASCQGLQSLWLETLDIDYNLQDLLKSASLKGQLLLQPT